MDSKQAKKILKKLDYLPRWAWYLIALSMFNFVGVIGVYLTFHVLNKIAADIDEEVDSGHAFGSDARRAPSGVYRDEDCTVMDEDEVEQRWSRTEASARRAAHADAEKSSPISEDASVADVLREGRSALLRIRRANDLIPDPMLSSHIDSIETSCKQILSILEQRPQLLPQLRTFLRYYLPTTLRLLDARARLESTANTPKAREVRTRISEALAVIDKAFVKQLESLDEYSFIDLESEMDVLRDMLRADGFVGDEEAAKDDPFAGVLGRQNGNTDSRNKPMATH